MQVNAAANIALIFPWFTRQVWKHTALYPKPYAENVPSFIEDPKALQAEKALISSLASS